VPLTIEKSCRETRFPQVSDTIRAWLITFRLTALSLLVWAPVCNRETRCTVHVRQGADWPNGRTAKYGIIRISRLVANRINLKRRGKSIFLPKERNDKRKNEKWKENKQKKNMQQEVPERT
jgi:hypothetical protein